MSSTLLFATPAPRDLERCERLETFPRSGRARPEFGASLRSIPVWPVVVLYRLDGNFVAVARVIDGRRDLLTLKQTRSWRYVPNVGVTARILTSDQSCPRHKPPDLAESPRTLTRIRNARVIADATYAGGDGTRL